MCLGFLMIREAEIDAAAEKAAKEVDAAAGGGNGHEGFSCDNTTISLIKSKDGSMKQVCRVPITSSGGGFAAVTMPKQFVANIVSTETPPECLAKELYALMNPEEFVPPIYTAKNAPIYRGLACHGSSDDKAMEVEPEIVVEFKCVTNAEGSKILIPSLCAVLGDNDPQELIRENKFEAYRVAMWEAFQKACEANDIFLPAFFDCEYDANGDWAVTPIAALQFVDSLFTSLVKGLQRCCSSCRQWSTDVPTRAPRFRSLSTTTRCQAPFGCQRSTTMTSRSTSRRAFRMRIIMS